MSNRPTAIAAWLAADSNVNRGEVSGDALRVEIVRLDAELASALDAIRYVLDRTQVDPDLGYYLGFGSEAWARLVRAEAVSLGEDAALTMTRRAADLQPSYRKRRPQVVELREQIERMESGETEEGDDE